MKEGKTNMQESVLSEFCQQKSGTSPLENGDRTRFYFQKLLNIQHSLSTIIAINIALMVIYSSQAFAYQGKNQLILDIILYGMFGCSLIQIIISLSRVRCKLQLEKEQKLIHSTEGLMSSGRIYYLFLESLIFIIQPLPYLKQYKIMMISSVNPSHQYYFYINEILCIFCLFRVYVFGRTLLLKTTYLNPRSHRLCRLHGCQATYQYALKCLFKDKPSLLILIGFGASIIIFGFAIQVCERPLVRSEIIPTNLGLFQNAIWLTIETMTTVGFGDLYPYTVFGRVIVLIIVVWGIFIVPIMVVVVTNTLQMEKAEIRTLVVLNRLSVSSQIKQLAAEFIGSVLKARKQTNLKKLEKRKKDILRLKQKFKKKNIQLKGLEYNDDTYEQMSRKFQDLNEDIKILNRNQEQLINYLHNNFECEQQNREQNIKEQKQQ